MSDFSNIFIWWLILFLIGLTTLPLNLRLFGRFRDKGYIFSKVLGILLSTYIVWFLGSLHLLPFVKMTIILVLIALAIVNIYLLGRKNGEEKAGIPWKWLIFEELIFFFSLWFWSYVRANEPSIRGLEKYMDYGFVNSILRASFFPPLDMWLTRSPDYNGGFFINYYYYGHYIAAFLTKLSGIDSAVTYNLMLATLYAFTFGLSFSLGLNLLHFFHYFKFGRHYDPTNRLKLVIAGLLAAFIVTLGGNLHTIYTFTSGYPNETPKPFWQLEFGYYPERYWYPNATRFIPNTIHEFPIYSYVVADLHGHVSDIPFVLLFLALCLNLIVNFSFKRDSPGNKKGILAEFENHTFLPVSQLLLLGLLLAVMYMTNAWDGLIYLIFAVLVFFYLNARSLQNESIYKIFYRTFSALLFLVFFFLLFNFPFMINFRPFVSGIGVLCAPKFLLEKKIGPFLFETGKCQKSPFYMMALLWGFFYFNLLGFLLFVIIPKFKNYLSDSKLNKGIRRLFTNFFHFLTTSLSPVDVFILIIGLVSTLLLIFPEYFYIKDIYPAHYRANTMFKLGYQAFMMLGVASGYIILRFREYIQEHGRNIFHLIYNTFFIMLFTLIAIYPYFAINSYYGRLSVYRGLDGLAWMKEQFADDYAAIAYLRKNILCPEGSHLSCSNQPVIAEAVGESYTDYARVSAYTGLPTIVGWPVHEWLWRGSYDEAGKRIPEVETLYQTTDIEAARAVIKKYNVQYIFVGSLEKEKYLNLQTDKFNILGDVIFEQGQTKIYRVKSNF